LSPGEQIRNGCLLLLSLRLLVQAGQRLGLVILVDALGLRRLQTLADEIIDRRQQQRRIAGECRDQQRAPAGVGRRIGRSYRKA